MIAAILVALQTILVFFMPAAVLLLVAITASYSDSRGVLEFINALFPGYLLYSRVLFAFLFSFGVCKYAVLRGAKIKGSLRSMCDASLCLVTLTVLSFIANGHGVLRGIQDLYFNPISYLFMFIVFNRGKESAFLWYAGAQILLAVAVITLPAFEMLDARQVIAMGGSYVGGDAYDGIGSIDFENVNKIDVGQYAHFQNPNTLGFYSGIAIAVGIIKLAAANTTTVSKLAYAAVMLSGLFGWLVSLTRGPMIALFISSVVYLVYARNKAVIGVVLLSAIVAVLLSDAGLRMVEGVASYLFLDPTDISVTSRLDGYSNGLAAIVNSPFCGVTNNWDWGRGVPHLLPLHYASFYGIPAGVIASWVYYFIPLIGFVRIWRSGRVREVLPYAQVYAVLAAISLTNNAPGTCLFGFGIAYVQMNIHIIMTRGKSQTRRSESVRSRSEEVQT